MSGSCQSFVEYMTELVNTAFFTGLSNYATYLNNVENGVKQKQTDNNLANK